MNLNSENDKIYFLKIKVKKNKKMKNPKGILEVAKSDLTKTKLILEPPTIKQDKNPNYYYDLFGDKFIYCGIFLSTDGLKENGNLKKHPFFLINMTK
jgi:hypothetical protein